MILFSSSNNLFPLSEIYDCILSPQMIRLPNGELAQVTVTPLGSGGGTPGSAGVGGGVPQNQFPAQQQQQPVLLKPIPTKQPPPAQSQPQQQPQTQQQQVVVNMAGQQFLLTQGGGGGVPQQAANPPSAAGRGQALPQQPGQVHRPQQHPQQQPVKLVSQQAPSVPVQPSQQQQQLLQKQFSPGGGGSQPSGPTAPASSMQQSVTPSSSSSSAQLNALPSATMVAPTVHSSTSSVATIARTTSGGTAVRLAGPAPSSVIGSSSLPSVTSVASVNSAVKYPASSGGQAAAYPPALPSYSGGGGGVEGEILQERLENLDARGEEEGRDTQWPGELEHER